MTLWHFTRPTRPIGGSLLHLWYSVPSVRPSVVCLSVVTRL